MQHKNHNLAFVFPGQGSQVQGMLSKLSCTYPIIKETFAQASDVLNFDLWKLVQDGPVVELNQTHNTQPAMLAAGVAIWRIWCNKTHLRPAWVAGHSLGEYTALVCAESISFKDGIKLVSQRGLLMQQAVPVGVGSMAAIIGLDDQSVIKICANCAGDEVLAAVNFNAPNQVVIAGHTIAVDRAMNMLKTQGAKITLKLPVSVPAHCILMQPVAEKLYAKLQDLNIKTPKIKLIHNADVATHNVAETIRQTLKAQLYKPVRWVELINYMYKQGVDNFIECGPGKVLMGLNKRIVKTANHMAIFDHITLTKTLEQLNG